MSQSGFGLVNVALSTLHFSMKTRRATCVRRLQPSLFRCTFMSVPVLQSVLPSTLAFSGFPFFDELWHSCSNKRKGYLLIWSNCTFFYLELKKEKKEEPGRQASKAVMGIEKKWRWMRKNKKNKKKRMRLKKRKEWKSEKKNWSI